MKMGWDWKWVMCNSKLGTVLNTLSDSVCVLNDIKCDKYIYTMNRAQRFAVLLSFESLINHL